MRRAGVDAHLRSFSVYRRFADGFHQRIQVCTERNLRVDRRFSRPGVVGTEEAAIDTVAVLQANLDSLIESVGMLPATGRE